MYVDGTTIMKERLPKLKVVLTNMPFDKVIDITLCASFVTDSVLQSSLSLTKFEVTSLPLKRTINFWLLASMT